MTKARVLVVDDNATNLKLVAFIATASGYEVVSATDAPSALAALRVQKPAVVLVDLQLPGIDGLELTRTIRSDPTMAGIAIIAVTAYAMKGDREKALAAGCDDYVTKPIDTRALPGIIAKHVRGLDESAGV
jgi:two-component system cell cycle response regulator DivK